MEGELGHRWKPVTADVMKGFTAIILNMGIIQLPNIKDYCSTIDTTDLPFFQSVFSQNHFFQILGSLHVGDITSSLKRDKIQPLISLPCPVFQSFFHSISASSC